MDELLLKLSNYSQQLKSLDLIQVAADYDYFVAWFKSTDWAIDGSHLPPNPAGLNTIDEYSNNCPIPYMYYIPQLYDENYIDLAVEIIRLSKSIFESLLNMVDDDIEITAIKSYIYYSKYIISKLLNEDIPDIDPEPEPDPEPQPDPDPIYPPIPIQNKLITGGLLSVDDGVDDEVEPIFEEMDFTGLLGIAIYLIETNIETGILEVDQG